MRADPEDVFVVSSSKGFVHITCRKCGWHAAYPGGNDQLREEVKDAALEHLVDEKEEARRQLER